MLEPHSRQLLRDALRPPAGYSLDRAVTTTFSLDLMALLTIPVSFTFFQLKDHDGPPSVDPLALLEALRRHASRLTVFCQAGQIHIPPHVQLLLGYVEDTVHQVRAPRRDGVFHPKVTVLRFKAEHAADAANVEMPSVVYRVLCSSRNLTFDRSWDTMLVLEGPLAAHRTNAFARNHPLARFVASLPELGVYAMETGKAEEIRVIAHELLRVDFQNPAGFDDLEFCPLGLDQDTSAGGWPILRHRRILAMAPFVSDGFLRRAHEEGKQLAIISRVESLDELSVDSIAHLSEAWYMDKNADRDTIDSAADILEGAGAQSSDGIADSSVATRVELAPSAQLDGLHAKLFVADDGWNAHVYTGSANATAAAFENNVEFLVRLSGKKAKCGINHLLRRDDQDRAIAPTDRSMTFADLLVKYRRDSEPIIDHTRKALEHLLDKARYTLASAKFTGRVEAVASESAAAESRYNVTLMQAASNSLKLPPGVSASCHPLTLKASNAVELSLPVPSTAVVFNALSFEALTSFYAFQLVARIGDQQMTGGFVLNVPLTGLPSDRAGRLLLALLGNREQLLRYLLMLLADDEDDARRLVEAFEADGRNKHSEGSEGGFGLPLLEPLLQALDRRPTRLDQIAALIDDLRKTPQGRDLISDQFMSVWEPIWIARSSIGHE